MTFSALRPTVVLADDHPAMVAEVLTFLQPHCDVVAAVESGTLAVQAVNEHRPDIAILDIAMPGMSGIEAAQRLSELESSTKIVFLTVQADPDYIEAADALGAGYVLKSRMRSDLLIAIEKALGRRVSSSLAKVP